MNVIARSRVSLAPRLLGEGFLPEWSDCWEKLLMLLQYLVTYLRYTWRQAKFDALASIGTIFVGKIETDNFFCIMMYIQVKQRPVDSHKGMGFMQIEEVWHMPPKRSLFIWK